MDDKRKKSRQIEKFIWDKYSRPYYNVQYEEMYVEQNKFIHSK